MATGTITASEVLKFRKMHGIGNDFVMVDCVNGSVPAVDPVVLARQVCDRKFGVGADGLIYVEREGADLFRMRMWNPDGSESEMCGNGIRCVAKLLVDEGTVSPADGRSGIPIETGAGRLVLEVLDSGMVRVDMGKAWLTRGEIGMIGPSDEHFVSQDIGGGLKGTAVSMGNPHLVILVDDASEVDLAQMGPKLEHHELFPSRTNVHFVQVVDHAHLIQRTWERGAGATLACGTGACASAVAAFLNGASDRNVDIDLPGGRLKIEYAEDGRVFMTGPAETVYDGEWPL